MAYANFEAYCVEHGHDPAQLTDVQKSPLQAAYKLATALRTAFA